MNANLERGKKLVWARVQKKLGFIAPPEVKKYIDSEAGPVRDSEDLEDYEGTVSSFLGILKLLAISQCFPPQKINPNTSKKGTKKTYLRPLQNRSYLVNFVINRHLIIIMETRKNISHRRFNWRQICNQWNDAHSYDTMNPLDLKATYYRAAADKDVQKTILIKQIKLLEQSLEKALDEGWIDQVAINNLGALLQMPKSNMPSSFKAKYLDFTKKMADALESIYRD